MPDLRQRALQLLTRREHSRAELRSKLAGEAESAATLDAVLDALEAECLLSDVRYARQRVSSRGGRYGNGRLRQELRQRGISEADIADALPDAGDETRRCRAVWQRKFGVLPNSAAERARQWRFLQYRGFTPATIEQAMRGIADEPDTSA